MKTTLILLLCIASAATAITPTKPASVANYERVIRDADQQYQTAVKFATKSRNIKLIAARKMMVRALDMEFKAAQRKNDWATSIELAKRIYGFDQTHTKAIALLLAVKIDLASLPIKPEVSNPKVASVSVLEICGLKYKGHTYLPVYKTVTWKEADALCKKMGGHLVYFETAEEMKVLAAIPTKGKTAFWVGATRSGKNWKWGNGNPVNVEFADGNPANTCMKYSNGSLFTREDKKRNATSFLCEWE